jgi:hypothetical protein
MFGTRKVSDLGFLFFLILEYLHVQNEVWGRNSSLNGIFIYISYAPYPHSVKELRFDCDLPPKVRCGNFFHCSSQKLLHLGAFWISDFQIRDV